MKNPILLKIQLALIFFFILVYFILGYMHEQVHVSIYDSYGIESSVEYFSHFPDFVTIVSTEDYIDRCNDSCKLANSINEGITYPLIAFLMLLTISLFIIISELVDIRVRLDEGRHLEEECAKKDFKEIVRRLYGKED